MSDDTGTGQAAPLTDEVHKSSRDLGAVRADLEAWLRRRPGRGDAAITDLRTTSATGMSSETLLLEVAWTEDGEGRTADLVARVAPDRGDVPVFPDYDMTRQFEVMGLVGQRSAVPVPRVVWNESDTSVIGAPFFVMERVEGDVPPDLMPYPFGGNWLFDAAPADQRRLQDATVDALVGLHDFAATDPVLAFLAFPEPGDTPLRRHVAHARAWYDYAAGYGHRSPLVERGFGWLEDHWPRQEGDAVLAWGDSRIGNVMYRDFRPVAVLDWEMVGLAPREVDLGWMIYAHRAFQVMAETYGLPGMPSFLQPDDVAARYEAQSSHSPRDLDFYIAYAAVQWGIVGLITGLRAVHFGERELPDDVDELLYARASIEPLLG